MVCIYVVTRRIALLAITLVTPVKSVDSGNSDLAYCLQSQPPLSDESQRATTGYISLHLSRSNKASYVSRETQTSPYTVGYSLSSQIDRASIVLLSVHCVNLSFEHVRPSSVAPVSTSTSWSATMDPITMCQDTLPVDSARSVSVPASKSL